MNGNLDNLQRLLAQAQAGIGPSYATPPSPLTDLDSYCRNLTPEERRAIDSDPRVLSAKGNVYDLFIAYSLNSTPVGQQFCSGAGLTATQSLLDTVKSVHRETAGKIEEKSLSFEKRLAELEEANKKLDAVNKDLLKQLGVTPNV